MGSIDEGQAQARAHDIPEHLLPGLDPEWVEMWNEHGRHLSRADEVSIEEYRKNPPAYNFTYASWKGPEVHHEEEFMVPMSDPEGEVRIRVYSPAGPGPFPVHLNMHGGGWVLGGLESEAAWCRSTCNKANVKVVDIDYRMAPEFVFPIGIYDCWRVLKWVISNASRLNVRKDSISIGGLSAGGTNSALMSHWARDEGIVLKLALLVVPSCDFRWCIAEEPVKSEVEGLYPSIALVKNNPWGPYGRFEWFMSYWIPKAKSGLREAASKDWIPNVVLAPNLGGLPRTHMVTAEFDLSRSETEEYCRLLREAGNEVSIKCYRGMPHAFGHYNHPERGLKQSHLYMDETADMIRRAHEM